MSAFAGIPEFIFAIAAKLSLGLLIFASLLLFISNSALEYLGLIEFVNSYKAQISILFLLSAAILLSSVIKFCWEWFLAKSNEWTAEAELNAKKSEALIKIAKRLDSLTLSEKQWVKYCLYHNQQTFIANVGNSTGNSLANKALVVVGEGHVMSLPFTFPDHVWQYLIENKGKFLPEVNTSNRAAIEKELEGFKRSQGIM